MKKILTLLGVLFLLGSVSVVARADSTALPEEAIVSYHSSVAVNSDNSVDVSEKIIYNTGPQNRHGIYRDIRPFSSQNIRMSIENVSVFDENGNPYPFQVSDFGTYVRVKIGDPNKTFVGQNTYIINYHATRAVAQLQDLDEIYWNTTGNDWLIPIYKADAVVFLPNGVSATQFSCYYGINGSTNQCSDGSNASSTYTFSTSNLNPKEGLTVAVGFAKGVVAPYSAADKSSVFFDTYLPWIISGLLPILTLIFSLLYWYKKGRDAKGKGVIIPQYDVPDSLTPMEVAGILNEEVTTKDVSAEIIYLATKGYIKINQLEDSFIGFIKRTDYELVKLKDFSDLPNEFDQKLIKALFESDQKTVRLSSLKSVFFEDASEVITSSLDSLLNKGYYSNLGRMKTIGNRMVMIAFMSVWASMFFGGILGGVFLKGNFVPVAAGIFLSIVIYAIVSHFSPAKTMKGVVTKEYILGLKNYLQIAEKDRLLFHDAPEKKPEVFEKLLPFAMVLGVADIWAKEFEGIYNTPPSWYSSPHNTVFNAVILSHSLGDFNSFAASSMSASSGGGSGGGGFSGGGGGGGGGGGW